MRKPLVIVVAGPTASGKTSLSVELAKKFGGEIVSADSMQIYKNMDIATAKPSADEMAEIRHHLIGFVDCNDEYSVAMYKNDALNAIKDILSRGKLPIVCGGTGLYIDTLIKNTSFFDYNKSNVRSELEREADEKGIEHLFERLKETDPETALRLHLNDRKRIIRALEVYLSTGKTISEQERLSHLEESEFEWCVIGLTASDRQFLYDRINRRVDTMLETGLLHEAEEFFGSEYSATAKQAIGYKELKPYFDGLVSLEEAVEKLKMETRRYAKRQLTWFRRNDKINWIDIDRNNSDEITDIAAEIIKKYSGD